MFQQLAQQCRHLAHWSHSQSLSQKTTLESSSTRRGGLFNEASRTRKSFGRFRFRGSSVILTTPSMSVMAMLRQLLQPYPALWAECGFSETHPAVNRSSACRANSKLAQVQESDQHDGRNDQ